MHETNFIFLKIVFQRRNPSRELEDLLYKNRKPKKLKEIIVILKYKSMLVLLNSFLECKKIRLLT